MKFEKEITVKEYERTAIKGSLIPNSQLEIGDTVYYITGNKIHTDKIEVISANVTYFSSYLNSFKIRVEYSYDLEEQEYNTYKLYKTREEAEAALEKSNQSIIKFKQEELDKTLKSLMYKCKLLEVDPIDLVTNYKE